ncbi:MAG: ParA family protein [Agarilytica sp.]
MSAIVIAFASSKGGAGKTTSAFLLATVLAKKDMKVAVIDADPNHPFGIWKQQGGQAENLTIIKNENEESILDDIEEAKKNHQFVIIDLEGTANLSVAYAVTTSDLVIIPSQRSQLDASEAAKVIGLVKRQSVVSGREIPAVLLFTRTSPAIRTKGMRRMQQSLDTNNVDTFEVEVNEREAFKAIWDYTNTLYQLDHNQVSGLDKARANATSFTVEVLTRIQDIRNNKNKKSDEVA